MVMTRITMNRIHEVAQAYPILKYFYASVYSFIPST